MDQISSSKLDNQRKHTRFVRDDIKVSILPVSFLGMKEPISCKLIDICSAGLQISTKEKFRVNTNLSLILQFDDGHELKLKAKIVRQKETNHYLTNHSFNIGKDSLKNENNPLKSVHLLNSGNKIEAKYRFLNLNCIRTLTYSPLNKNKQYKLLFTLKNKQMIKTDSQIKSCQHHIHYNYGLKFESTNDALGEHLLETQTDLIFK